MNPDEYNASIAAPFHDIVQLLKKTIDEVYGVHEAKIWHGGPVWFDNGNPVVGYWERKDSVALLFWSGQSFNEPGLTAEGKFKAAEKRYRAVEEVNTEEIRRWLAKATKIQWDYRNIVKRKGVLKKLGNW